MDTSTENTREFVCVHPEFNQQRSFTCVEYPAIVKNDAKMMKTLGGMKKLQKTFNNKTSLELYFRPNDPTSKPVSADPTDSTTLVVRVRKYRRKVKAAGGPEEIMYRPEVLGIADKTYKFRRLHEFQFLPVQKDMNTEKFESMIPYLGMRPGDITSDLLTVDQTVPMFINPLIYSRFDKPQNILFAKKVEHRKKPDLQAKEVGMSRRKRHNNAICWDIMNDGAPTEPLPIAMQELKRYTENITNGDDSMETQMKKMFAERPIWSRSAICCLTKTSKGMTILKRILPTIAYYYCNGPWRGLWVRFGYNPKKDKRALLYQLIEYRVRRNANLPVYLIKPHRSASVKKKIFNQPKNMSLSAAISKAGEEGSQEEEEESVQQNSYKFIPGVLPPQRQTFYQYIDIEIPEVKSLVESILVQVEDSNAVCDVKYGWVPENTASTVRKIINEYVSRTLKAVAGNNAKTDASTDDMDDTEVPEEDDASSEFEDEEETDVSSDEET